MPSTPFQTIAPTDETSVPQLHEEAAAELTAQGFVVLDGVVPAARIAGLLQSLEVPNNSAAVRERNRSAYAVRNLLRVPAVAELANSAGLRGIVEPILGRAAKSVRGILFDKTPGANWKVAWHQDLSIAVKEQIDVAGFGPWSVKAGVVHVQPPRKVLEGMVTLRLHLDDCLEENGPLMVLPGSHAHGVLSPGQVEHWRANVKPVACVAAAGGLLVMRPLVLHASFPAASPNHRRVIHIEYACGDLQGGLRWDEAEETDCSP